MSSAALATHGREISAVDPDRTAVISSDRQLSFGELDQQAEGLARFLADQGMAEGDTLALLCTNRPEWLVTYQAALRAGLRLVPINWHLEADDITYVLSDSGATALVVEAPFVADTGALTAIADLPRPTIVVDRHSPGDAIGFDDAIAAGGPEFAPRRRGSLMIYTSGTTGRPKGVEHQPSSSDGAEMGAAMVAMFGMDGDRGDSMLCPAPLYHSGPSRLCGEWPLGAGVTVVLMDRFDAEGALQLIDQHRISHAFFVPTMFHRMLAVDDRERFDVSSLRFVLHGAGPCDPAAKAAMFEWLGPVIHEIYASSEGPGTWIGPDEWLAHPGSVGRADPSRIEIRNDAGQPSDVGAHGEVWFRATAGFDYHGDPAKTASTFDNSGQWYSVGDRGHVDADGYLYLTGRTAECIVSGGVNIYPARIDEALASHAAVVDAAAFGVPDREFGEVVAAAVVLDATASADVTPSILEHCRSTIGSQLTPRSIFVVDELPRTDAGKLYRRRLTDQFSPQPDPSQ
ncbi:MAG: AMP-binding protein [Acidimicrobiales bacterium]